MQVISRLISLARQQLMPALDSQEPNFNRLTICCVYENTRDANCKGIKGREALRSVRTGADAGLAK
jgi:hypothetical protein